MWKSVTLSDLKSQRHTMLASNTPRNARKKFGKVAPPFSIVHCHRYNKIISWKPHTPPAKCRTVFLEQKVTEQQQLGAHSLWLLR